MKTEDTSILFSNPVGIKQVTKWQTTDGEICDTYETAVRHQKIYLIDHLLQDLLKSFIADSEVDTYTLAVDLVRLEKSFISALGYTIVSGTASRNPQGMLTFQQVIQGSACNTK